MQSSYKGENAVKTFGTWVWRWNFSGEKHGRQTHRLKCHINTWRWAYFREQQSPLARWRPRRRRHFALSFPSIKAVLLLQNTAEILGLSQILHHITFCVWATQPRRRRHISKQLLCKRWLCVCVCVGLFPSKWSQFCGFRRSIAQNNTGEEEVYCSLGLFNIKNDPKALFKILFLLLRTHFSATMLCKRQFKRIV